MPTEKVSMTLDAEVLKHARARAGKRGLSSFVDEALRKHLQLERARELLEELEHRFGPLTEDEKEEGRRAWAEAGKAKRRASRRT